MVAKTILEIDVNDDRFKDFLASYESYQKSLEGMPDAWRAIGLGIGQTNKPAGEAAGHAEEMATSFRESLEVNRQLLTAMNSVNSNTASIASNTKSFGRESGGAKKFLEGGAKAAKSMAGDIKDATLSLLKWGSIISVFSGLAGGGGLFGITRLAQSAGATRFTSMGLGTTAGGLNSVAVNYQRALSNPAGTLGNIRDVQADLSRRWAFDAVGIRNGANADPAKLLPQLIKNARDIFTKSGSTLQGAEAHGLTQFFTIDDLNRFQRMSNAEIDGMAKRADADMRQMQLSDQVMRQWQDFSVQLDRSGVSIRSAFISGLAPLEPQLERLSEAVSNFLTNILKSPQFGQWMDAAAKGLERFANYLTSPEFENDAREFMHILEGLTHAIGSAARWISSKFGGSGGGDTPSGAGFTLPAIAQHDEKAQYGSSGLDKRSWFSGLADKATDDINASKAWSEKSKQPLSVRNHNPLNLRMTYGSFAKYQDDAEGFRAAANQLHRYSNGKTFGVPVNTLRGIISKWAPPSENNTEAYINNVVKRTGFKENERLDLDNPAIMAKLLQAMSKQENHKSNYQASGIQLVIQNNTGGNAIVSSAQLAGN